MSEVSPEWAEITANKPFIMDLGFQPGTVQRSTSEEPLPLGQFAAFLPIPNQARHQIVEVSQDVEYLKRKYGVPEDHVLRVAAPQPPAASLE
jgi:hypothetical protein